MSYALGRYVRAGVSFINKSGVRHKWYKRGMDPEIQPSLEQKLAEWNNITRDPELYYKVDIGYRYVRPSRKEVLSERLKIRKEMKSSYQVEKAARSRTLSVPMDNVYEEWCKTNGPFQLKEVAEYFNVFQDLFGDAYFTPVTILDIRFPQNEEFDAPVYHGNLLKPAETAAKPLVQFNGVKDALYTLVLSSPDCHLTEENGEYLHWLVGNIPSNEVSQGLEVCDYLQPFPFRGLGYCRYVFVLYRQDKVIDFSKYQRPSNCKNLTARTFSTYEFYRDLQDVITPCGLSFFQSNWDRSLTAFFHDVLEMKEPWFEYNFEEPSLPPQEWIPTGKPFNLYLDRYKDRKQLGKELLLEKLKEVHPFEKPPPPPKYPQIYTIPYQLPTWLKDDIKRRRGKTGKWKYM